MSVTLTDRDTTNYVCTVASNGVGETVYSVAGGSITDYRALKARHSGMGQVTKNSRHNVRLERTKINGAGLPKVLATDFTISMPNDGTFSADDVDDAVTALRSFFASEAMTGDFVIGVNPQ